MLVFGSKRYAEEKIVRLRFFFVRFYDCFYFEFYFLKPV
jgi:hypothetical protein